MDSITTRTVANGFAEVDEIVLEEKPKTRTVFKANIHEKGIRGEIIRYKKGNDGKIEDIVPVDFKSLHENEGIKIRLSTAALSILFQKIEELYQILIQKGVENGTNRYAVVSNDELVITDRNKARIIEELLRANYGEDVWNQLAENNPDIATRLANSKIQNDRIVAINKFEQMLQDNMLPENDWQDFFTNNKWIFGYGLRYQILRMVQEQPAYGGADITGAGGQRGDYLFASEAEVRYTCLVEIKKPNTPLLHSSEYRNGAWAISSEVAGAVSQVLVNCAQWEISGARTDQNRDLLEEIYTVNPKGIVVVGNTSELNTRDKKNSFERFRRELHNPEIITFDELLARARFIVENT